jgi:hypothetical protein
MAIKINDIVKINTSYIATGLVTQPSDPLLRQTITSLERLSNITSKILDRGMIADGVSGNVLHYIKLVPTSCKHISYRAPHDGPGQGITIYFRNLIDLESSFLI